MAVISPHSRIIQFYLGLVPGYEGRMIGDIWRWTRLELEGSPNAFNWLFPMPDNDVVRGGLPLYPEDVIHFKSDAILQANARKSVAWFAGIIWLSIDGDRGIAKGPSFAENFDPDNPVTIRRIRRVLRFLKMIGLDDATSQQKVKLTIPVFASESSESPIAFALSQS